MSDNPRGPLSEEQARRLWARASELQEEARRRSEQGKHLPAKRGTDAGFQLEHVRAAAVEAGIQKEFVDLAVAEMLVGADSPDPVVERRIARFLDSTLYALESSRVIGAPPDLVLDRMTDLVTRDPYGLTLTDQVGEDLIEGGALVFKAPGMMERKGEFGNAVNFSDMREFFFQARPVEDGRTELRVRAPLLYSRRLNYRVGVGFAGTLSAGLGLGSGTLAAGLLSGMLAGPLGWLAIGGAALVGGAGGAIAGVRSYRLMFRYGMRKGQSALDQLLRAIAVNVTARAGSAALQPPELQPPGLQPPGLQPPELQPPGPPSTRNEGGS